MEQPSGMVTLLFSDIEGSTRLLDELGAEGYRDALAEHRRVLRAAFGRHGGFEVDHEGDAFFVAFASAESAVAAAREAQQGLVGGPVAVRIGIHTGEPLLDPPKYVGADVHLAARIMSAGHGGQVVFSNATRELAGVEAVDLGEHRLKDFVQPIPLFQLGCRSFPPLKTISNTNLPRPASSFVGRAREVAEVVSLVRGGARLVTLTGPGGSGKTRLAIEAGAELVPAFKAGVFWVGLAALRDPALVLDTLGETLGAKEEVAAFVGERELLLLVDNLEQVIDAASDLASLLDVCPNLVLLVTSRELLRVRAEREFEVLPLDERDAVALFSARAQVEPAAAVVELCRRLDSIPLAIELAAARTKALTPDQILERLGDRLDLFKGGRDSDARQQTLRAMIEWSYDLLSDEERRLFARLSIFDGGCTLEAAEAVIDADIDTLQSLVEQSLVRFANGRYWMLETIRDYASECLRRSEVIDPLFERMLESLIGVAEAKGAPEFLGHLAAAFARLELEHPNVRALVVWATGHGRREPVLRLTAVLWNHWISQHLKEAAGWVEFALPGRALVPEAIRLPALVGAGEVMRFTGRLEQAVELKEELLAALPDYEGTVDPVWEIGTLVDLADIAAAQGDFERAEEYARRSIAASRERNMRPARALGALGEIALRQGDLPRAEELLGQAAAAFEERGNEANYASTLAVLGEIAIRRGDIDAARERLTEALQHAAALGDEGLAGECLQLLAHVAAQEGRTERAGVLWGAGLALFDASAQQSWRSLDDLTVLDHAKAAGAAMSLQEAVDYALSDIH